MAATAAAYKIFIADIIKINFEGAIYGKIRSFQKDLWKNLYFFVRKWKILIIFALSCF